MIDVRRARRETPGCEHVTHLNNAGASLPSPLLDSRARALPDLVRASVHYYNTDEELDRLVESVRIAALC